MSLHVNYVNNQNACTLLCCLLRYFSSSFLVLNRQICFQSDCLTLTLQELVHIRSVLTKAEIESLPVEGHFKEDVENRKVIIYSILNMLKLS